MCPVRAINASVQENPAPAWYLLFRKCRDGRGAVRSEAAVAGETNEAFNRRWSGGM
jgi:hypothetical protein